MDNGIPTAARRAMPPPFSTLPPLIKPEPIDDPAPGPFSAQASVPLMSDLFANRGRSAAKSGPYSRAAWPMSAGFKSAARSSFQQQLKAEGTRHSTGLLLPFASQSGPTPGSFRNGLPFGIPQPIGGPFAGTVFDPAPRPNSAEEDTQSADHAGTGQAAATEPKAEGTADGAVVPVAPTQSVTDVQLAAANAAVEDKQAAEQFAAGALQSPKAEVLHHVVSHYFSCLQGALLCTHSF